jgi:hypothetical protein
MGEQERPALRRALVEVRRKVARRNHHHPLLVRRVAPRQSVGYAQLDLDACRGLTVREPAHPHQRSVARELGADRQIGDLNDAHRALNAGHRRALAAPAHPTGLDLGVADADRQRTASSSATEHVRRSDRPLADLVHRCLGLHALGLGVSELADGVEARTVLVGGVRRGHLVAIQTGGHELVAGDVDRRNRHRTAGGRLEVVALNADLDGRKMIVELLRFDERAAEPLTVAVTQVAADPHRVLGAGLERSHDRRVAGLVVVVLPRVPAQLQRGRDAEQALDVAHLDRVRKLDAERTARLAALVRRLGGAGDALDHQRSVGLKLELDRRIRGERALLSVKGRIELERDRAVHGQRPVRSDLDPPRNRGIGPHRVERQRRRLTRARRAQLARALDHLRVDRLIEIQRDLGVGYPPLLSGPGARANELRARGLELEAMRFAEHRAIERTRVRRYLDHVPRR